MTAHHQQRLTIADRAFYYSDVGIPKIPYVPDEIGDRKRAGMLIVHACTGAVQCTDMQLLVAETAPTPSTDFCVCSTFVSVDYISHAGNVSVKARQTRGGGYSVGLWILFSSVTVLRVGERGSVCAVWVMDVFFC